VGVALREEVGGALRDVIGIAPSQRHLLGVGKARLLAVGPCPLEATTMRPTVGDAPAGFRGTVHFPADVAFEGWKAGPFGDGDDLSAPGQVGKSGLRILVTRAQVRSGSQPRRRKVPGKACSEPCWTPKGRYSPGAPRFSPVPKVQIGCGKKGGTFSRSRKESRQRETFPGDTGRFIMSKAALPGTKRKKWGDPRERKKAHLLFLNPPAG